MGAATEGGPIGVWVSMDKTRYSIVPNGAECLLLRPEHSIEVCTESAEKTIASKEFRWGCGKDMFDHYGGKFKTIAKEMEAMAAVELDINTQAEVNFVEMSYLNEKSAHPVE